MVGAGSELDYLRRIVAQQGLDHHVHFAGTLVKAERNAFLANSDLFVMPSTVIGQDVEGFGIAYIEAGYFAIPSVATRSGGACEAVIHEQTGLVCEPEDLEQLRKNIISLLDDKSLRQSLGDNAARRSRELLWKNQIQAYRQLLYES
jgi:phosphatidylinositol alpha-1,6-mannosyltransferase